MKFTKMHGIGNDYVYIETFTQPAPADPASDSRSRVSDRHFGMGSDGLILVMPSKGADARMRMFNADGSEGEMCGNGVRCVAKFLYDHGLAGKRRWPSRRAEAMLSLALEVAGGKVSACSRGHGIAHPAPPRYPTLLPVTRRLTPPIELTAAILEATAVSMGNPHAVIYVEDVERFPAGIAGADPGAPSLFPRRVNVHIVD